MIRLLILTRRFEYGGAERQLIALVKGLDKTRFAITIATFYEGGELLAELEHLQGVEVIPLRKKARWDLIPFLRRLWRTVATSNPHVIYGYMGVANKLALLFGKLSNAKVAWGVRASNMDLDRYDWLMRALYKLECWCSRFPDLIISNSESGKTYHVTQGFPPEKVVVIPNGIATGLFAPDPIAREKLRAEWEVSEKETLIGLVARLDPMKDHPTFLKAAALASRERPDFRFACIGDGSPSYRLVLQRLSKELGLTGCLRWVGFRADMPAVYNALDIACSSSSYGEGFSNAIGEAMACGVPCVVTDVGDAKLIVGHTGRIVAPRDPAALASAWRAILDMESAARVRLGLMGRARIVQQFSLERLVEDCSRVLLDTLSGK